MCLYIKCLTKNCETYEDPYKLLRINLVLGCRLISRHLDFGGSFADLIWRMMSQHPNKIFWRINRRPHLADDEPINFWRTLRLGKK